MPSYPIAIVVLVLSAIPAFCAQPQASFDAAMRHWTLDNKWIRAEFDLTEEGYFRSAGLTDLKTGDQWLPQAGRPTSMVRFQVDDTWFDAQMPFELVEHYTEAAPRPDCAR